MHIFLYIRRKHMHFSVTMCLKLFSCHKNSIFLGIMDVHYLTISLLHLFTLLFVILARWFSLQNIFVLGTILNVLNWVPHWEFLNWSMFTLVLGERKCLNAFFWYSRGLYIDASRPSTIGSVASSIHMPIFLLQLVHPTTRRTNL